MSTRCNISLLLTIAVGASTAAAQTDGGQASRGAVPAGAVSSATVEGGSPRIVDVSAWDATTRGALGRAFKGALRRVERPECERIFAEYSDAAGVPLVDKLRALDRTGAEYLATILFADGGRQGLCRHRRALARAVPGSRVVFVCRPQLVAWQQEDPRYVEAVVIHEALHTLGPGENPPTSAAITHGVLERCGG